MQYAGLGGLGALQGAFPGLATSSAAASPASTTTTSTSNGGQNGASSSSASGGGGGDSNNAQAAWYAMASQLAAQDYLSRLQAAARDPAAYAALASQGVLPNYEMLTQGSKASSGGGGGKGKGKKKAAPHPIPVMGPSAPVTPAASSSSSVLDSLRLPSDTEIIKYTSSSTGPKVPGTTNRGRKKTISLDPTPVSVPRSQPTAIPIPIPSSSAASTASTLSASNLGALGALLGAAAAQQQQQGGLASALGGAGSNGSASLDASPPTIPAGLTIERKRPGRKSIDSDGGHIPSSLQAADMVDKVEITKVPINASSASSSLGNGGRSCSPSVSITARDFPSSSASLDAAATLSSLASAASASRPTSAATITPSSTSSSSSKIPSEYYASQALSGVFLAEQIRQQQLAAALESRLSESTGKSAAASSSTSAAATTAELMQAALLMNRLKEQQQQSVASSSTLDSSETSKLLAIAAAAAAASGGTSVGQATSWSKSSKSKKVPPKKNTVASLLEQAKGGGLGKLTPEELMLAEKATGNPELTIEPLFNTLKPDRYDIGMFLTHNTVNVRNSTVCSLSQFFRRQPERLLSAHQERERR